MTKRVTERKRAPQAMSPVLAARNQLGALGRKGASDEEKKAARCELALAKLRVAIRAAVDLGITPNRIRTEAQIMVAADKGQPDE